MVVGNENEELVFFWLDRLLHLFSPMVGWYWCVALVVAAFRGITAVNPIESRLVIQNGTIFLYHKGELRRLPATQTQETIDSLFAVSPFFPPPPQTNSSKATSWAPFPSMTNFPFRKEEKSTGTDIPVLFADKFSLDELMRINIATIYALQQIPLFHSLSDLGPYINPSLLMFQGRLLLATGASWSFPGMMDGHGESNTLLFKWHNHFTQILSHGIKQYKDKLFLPTTTSEANRPLPPPPVPPDKKFLGLSPHLEYLQDIPIPGQDPRLLVVDDDTILSWNLFGQVLQFCRSTIRLIPCKYSISFVRSDGRIAVRKRTGFHLLTSQAPHLHRK